MTVETVQAHFLAPPPPVPGTIHREAGTLHSTPCIPNRAKLEQTLQKHPKSETRNLKPGIRTRNSKSEPENKSLKPKTRSPCEPKSALPPPSSSSSESFTWFGFWLVGFRV